MGVLIAEGDMVVHEVGDGLNPRPARRGIAEQRPGDVGELVGLAIAARHQVQQQLVRQLVDRDLLRGRHHDVGQSGIAHQRAAAQGHAAAGGHQPAADIAKTVAIKSDRHVRLGDDGFGADDVGKARGVNAEHDHHRRRLQRGVGNLETDPDFHDQTFASSPVETTRMPISMPTNASAEPR